MTTINHHAQKGALTILFLALGTASVLGASRAEAILEEAGLCGGFIVHVGCGDGTLTAALHQSAGCPVQGLDSAAVNVSAARRHIQSLGEYGIVSVKQWDGATLPYVDHLVNLLVIEDRGSLSDQEIMRVLTPGGTALIKAGGDWEKVVKPRPATMADWSHYMYDATGNPVSSDTLVAPPVHHQWVGGPLWARHHDHMTSMNAMVSAGGKLFYVFDEGAISSIMLPAKWKLIARDAFNGTVLWKRDIPEWWTRFTPLKSGPAQLPRRLVAGNGRVYTTLGLRERVSEIDATTGRTIRTYDGTENTWELILSDGLLFVVKGSPRTEEEARERLLYADKGRAPGNPVNTLWQGWDRELLVFDTASGKAVWTVASKMLPGTLAADDGSVYFHNGESIVALDKRSGAERWTSQPVAAVDHRKGIPTGFMPSLAVRDGVVVFAGGSKYGQHMKGQTDTMVGIRAEDGRLLWEAPQYTSGYQSPQDVFIVGKTVVSPFNTWLKPKDPKNNHVVGTDLLSGKEVFDSAPDIEDPVWFIHTRCHPAKATRNYLLFSREGVEFVDTKTQHWKIHNWVRGACLYGIMPANGLLYAPMHNCACSADTKLAGLNALAGSPMRAGGIIDVTRNALTRGPAYGAKTARNEQRGDWPTFRGNAARSGVAASSVPTDLRESWCARIGGKLTAPVAAGGKVHVAGVDSHILHALDEETGAVAWTFTAEGRIDSPPTVHEGLVLFGGRDGSVYCLRATDGELVWQFRAVAVDRHLMAFGQPESVWPVHGSVLIREGHAWFVAGRSVFLDGGLQFYCLDPRTGEVLAHKTFTGTSDDGELLSGAEEKRMVGLPDILSASDGFIFMRAGLIKVDDDGNQAAPASKSIAGTRFRRDVPDPARASVAFDAENERLVLSTQGRTNMWVDRDGAPFAYMDKPAAEKWYAQAQFEFAGRQEHQKIAGITVYDAVDGSLPDFCLEVNNFPAKRTVKIHGNGDHNPHIIKDAGNAAKIIIRLEVEEGAGKGGKARYTGSYDLLDGKGMRTLGTYDSDCPNARVALFAKTGSGGGETVYAGAVEVGALGGESIAVFSPAPDTPPTDPQPPAASEPEGYTIRKMLLPASSVGAYGQQSNLRNRIPGEVRDHLFSSYGFLDDTWFHRSYWVYGSHCSHRHGYSRTGGSSPAGRILVYDDENVYGFGREQRYFNWTTPMEYRLFAEAKTFRPPAPRKDGNRTKAAKKKRAPRKTVIWQTQAPLLATGLVLAGDALFAAGPPDVLDESLPDIRLEESAAAKAMREQDAALAGGRGGVLMALDKADGSVKQRYQIAAPPVFDGVIAANSRLYMVLKNGDVQCWQGK